MRKPTPPVVLFLAAGASRRFGSDKRNTLFSRGQTLLQASLRLYVEAGCDVFVCLSAAPRDDDLARTLAFLPVEILRCSRASEGMGSTLGEAAGRVPGARPVLIALADMPLIRASTLHVVLSAGTPDRIVVPAHAERRGHPVLFGGAFRDALAQLSGDRGAASVVAANPEALYEVPVDDPGIYRDVDTPGALAALRSELSDTQLY